MKTFAFFILFAVGAFSLYEYQAGVFDWSIKNIGEIDTLFLANEFNIYFTLKDDDESIGSAFVENGLNRNEYFHNFYR